ncbi:hypothetical protein ABW20_dc0102125 [Dactylellina cionopaga]|nr:hypothetical protein ABW20_dc0102125 [Dactylellina cionopaga]
MVKRKRSPSASSLASEHKDGTMPEFTLRIKPPAKTLPRSGGGRKRRANRISSKFRFQLDLKTRLNIQPKAVWDRMKDYSIFVIGDSTFRKGDVVEVCRDAEDPRPWVARILQIKAHDAAHVYARIAWFYWPDELPQGRQAYHGCNELVESNHPDIINAMTVDGFADIKKWDEDDDDAELSGYYYRQQFDYTTKDLTPPKKICTCSEPHNPDSLIMHCQACGLWMHEECITADAVKRHEASGFFSKLGVKIKSVMSMGVSPSPRNPIEGDANQSVIKVKHEQQTVAALVFEGKLRVKEKPKAHDSDSDSGLDADTIVDEDIRCLNCNELIS